jgi:hypothetical protein
MTRDVDDAAARQREVVGHCGNLRRGDDGAETPGSRCCKDWAGAAGGTLEKVSSSRCGNAGRIVEGSFAAARYHLAIARERPWKLRLALVALQVAPRLMRAAYLRMRPAAYRTDDEDWANARWTRAAVKRLQ